MPRYLVTGATRGIGRAVVEELRHDELWLLARAPEPLEVLCASLPHATGRAVNLADPSSLAPALEGWLPDRLDGVVHSAGVAGGGPIADTDPADWARAFAVNVISVAELTRLCLPALRRAKGTVVTVNSGSGLVARAGGGQYSGTKYALRALTDALREEEADLRVTSVFPGRVDTDMQRDLQAGLGRDYDPGEHMTAATVAGVIVTALRLPVDAEMHEVAFRQRR